jgi:hypothetical protein
MAVNSNSESLETVLGQQNGAIKIEALRRAECSYRDTLVTDPADTGTRLRLAWCLFVQAVHQAGRESILEAITRDGERSDLLPGVIRSIQETDVDHLLQDCLRQTTTVMQLSRRPHERTDVEMLQMLVKLAGAEKWAADADKEALMRLRDITKALVLDTEHTRPHGNGNFLKPCRAEGE